MARKRKTTDDDTEATGFASHSWMLERLHEAQEADKDNREQGRECQDFVDKRDGQWEENWWSNCDGKPRYTFDLVSPILDQVQASVAKSDFDIRVIPASGQASKETAKTFDGLVRNIEAISNAREAYMAASKKSVKVGIGGWCVTQDYVEGDSFDQDLLIEKIPDWINSVWLGPHTEQDGSDAPYAFRLVGLSKDEFRRKYPDRSASAGVSGNKGSRSYYYRNDLVMVGQFYYLEESTRTLVQVEGPDGSVAVFDADSDEYKALADEMADAGLKETGRRKRTRKCVYVREFDANGWIDEPQKTVFENWIPLVPLYANFDVTDEGKVIWYGAVEKLIDPQRVFNYSLSREIEEGAFAPRAKLLMTAEQAAGHEAELATLNTNSDPVQLYNHVPDQAPPSKINGAEVNAGLARISEAMQALVGVSAGMFAANMGENPGLQSGKAIDALQDRGDWGNNKYIEARTIAQRHTGRILVDAIPRVYLPARQVRLLSEDGSQDFAVIGVQGVDRQTGKPVVLNDLSVGIYDVTCEAGPAFSNRQSQTVTALTEVGAIDPSVIQMGGDILLKNIPSPGMDQLAERKRLQLVMQGVIPPDQLTDEEKAMVQGMQGQQQPDPNMVLAMAEQAKANADMVAAQTKQMEAQAAIQQKEKELQIKAFEAETDRYKTDIERAKAMAEIKGKGAQAAKLLAEAEAIDIDNDMKTSGVHALAEKAKGAAGGEG